MPNPTGDNSGRYWPASILLQVRPDRKTSAIEVSIPVVARERRSGVVALLWVDDWVMPYQRLAVFCHVDVEFECADTEFDRFGKGSQRFAGRLAAAAGVGLQVESGRLG